MRSDLAGRLVVRAALWAVSTGMLATTFAGTAWALTSYDGDDYSFDWGWWGYGWVPVCDQETDGNGAYAPYQVVGGWSGTIRDPDGSQPGCGWAGPYSTYPYKHRACEDVAFWPDHCGPWVYPLPPEGSW